MSEVELKIPAAELIDAELFDKVIMENVWKEIRTMWINTNENLTDLLVLFYAKGDESLGPFIQGE